MNTQGLEESINELDLTLDACFVQRKRLDPSPNITDAVFSLAKAINRNTAAIHRQSNLIEANRQATKEAGEAIAAAVKAGFFGDELLGVNSPIQEGYKAIIEAINNHAEATLDAGDM